jgi:metallo-beta-lactamase family protein
MKLSFLGAARTVTGSCYHLLGDDGFQGLIEAGLYQGENADELNREPFVFLPRDLDAIVITHSHLDHSGMLPRIVREGFRGRIIVTSATRDLLELMLYDSAQIQKSDAEWSVKKLRRSGRVPLPPLYSADDVKEVLRLLEVREYGETFQLSGTVRSRLMDAGHIIGSSMVELWYPSSGREKKIVFSGDIGKKDNPIVNDPYVMGRSDVVVMESTYGNRVSKDLKESIAELKAVITETFRRGGNVYIPAFAVGRTQDILYILNGLVRSGELQNLHVYLDSPLAEKATKVYLAHPECFDEEAKHKFTAGGRGESLALHFVQSTQESIALNKIKSGIVVIAGSGMCEGGRIRHHLKHNLWRRESSLVFVGFQGKGTLGRQIVEGSKMVNVLGEEITVSASIHTINGFSAHADRDQLLAWLSHFQDSPEVFIVHGEEDAALDFQKTVEGRFGFRSHVPFRSETYVI